MLNCCLHILCVFVCVHHINRSAPNLTIIHIRKTKAVAESIRGLLERRANENKGIEKTVPGYKPLSNDECLKESPSQ